jgi:two-component system, LuxR family, sensor kinase FixL
MLGDMTQPDESFDSHFGTYHPSLTQTDAPARIAIDASLAAVITINEQGVIESVNAAANRLFGYGEAEMVGQHLRNIMTSPDRENCDEYLAKYLATGHKNFIGSEREVMGQLQDGTTFSMELAVSESKLGDKRQFTAIIRDITRRKTAEEQLKYFAEQLQERNLELSRSNEELERFTYAVSHDLKSPLVTIKGFVGRLQRHLEAGEVDKSEDCLSRISNAADRMGFLLDNLLTYSRVGRVVNPHEDIPLADLAWEVIELCDRSIQDCGMQVTLNEQLPVIRGDRFRLRELLQNLVENSVKFTKDVPNPQLEIGTITRWQHTICYVRDNGIGIEQPQQQHIFNMFEQLNREVPGSGIGLALAKRIVESHGGRIWVESDGIGSGCTMCFTLPAAENSSS